MNDVKKNFDEYTRRNPNHLTKAEFRTLEKKLSGNIVDEIYYDFMLWLDEEHPSRQETFAIYVSRKLRLKGKKGIRILEIGAGKNARTSEILSKEGFIMTCIDPRLDIKSKENLTCMQQKFDYQKFDLSKYDYVIAQNPCEVTKYIVKACIKANRPFIMELENELLSGKKLEDYANWHNYLQGLDEKITLTYEKLDPLSITSILEREID